MRADSVSSVLKQTRWWLAAASGVGIALVLAPLWILWCPGAAAWRTHVYHTVLYDQIAQRVTYDARDADQIVERLAEYVYTHVWPAYDAGPYDGKPLDYLVKGIGWCDYLAKIHMRLLATRLIPARYAMLRETEEVSPHTIAEVWSKDRWGLYDVLFHIRFTDAAGAPLTLEGLSASPRLLDAQPMMEVLRRQRPDVASQIQELYARVLPVAVSPRRSHPAMKRLTVFDRLALGYARLGGRRFVNWYQDRYLESRGWIPSATPEETLRLARHWHLAGRTAPATQAYRHCALEAAGSPVGAEARFWLGLLQWELDNDPAGALQTFEAGMAHDPTSRWLPMTWYYMGHCEEALGHSEQARAWYAKANTAGMIAAAFHADRLESRLSQPTGVQHASRR